jgi:predicted  nucleic acid-binding Zn-ribbon protein
VANVFHELLRVQDHDTAADQLRHRRDALPELTELAEVDQSLDALAATLDETVARRDEIARGQRRLEDELGSVEEKVRDLETRMYSGTVTVPRELQVMSEELEALRRRRSTLEDGVLEAMGEREPVDAEIAALEQARAQLEERKTVLTVAVAEAQAAIDADLGRELDARTTAAAGLPDELTRLYEQLRARLGGVGAARLVNGRCGGCHLALPATELDRMRRQPQDAVERCEQCGRLLVR